MMTGFNYPRQLQEVNAFYQGESPEATAGLLQEYGVHWVVIPNDSAAIRYFSGAPAAQIGRMRVYEIPDGRMHPYPGLAELDPSAANTRSLSRLVTDATDHISRLLGYFRSKGRA
jgi:hypothetical protein